MKKISNNLAWLIIGIALAVAGGVVYAANVSVPQSTQKGNYLSGLANGNYQTNVPCTNGQILAASSTSSSGWACVANTASLGATTTITSNVLVNGPAFIFATTTSGAGTLNITGSGTTINFALNTSGLQPAGTYVTNVTGSGNIVSSGGTTPNITFTGVLPSSNGGTGTTTLGSLTGGTQVTVSGGQNVLIGTSTSISLGTNVVTSLATGTAGTIFNGNISANTLTLNLPFASGSNTGQLQAADFTNFNNKLGSYNVISANGLISVATTTNLATLTASTSPTFTNLNVSGQTTLANSSTTNLTVTGVTVHMGTTTLATTTINGTLTVNSIANCNGTQFTQVTSGVFGCGTPAGGGGGSGVGTTTPFTAGFIPEATSTNVVLSNSNVFQSTAGNIGIGSTTPNYLLSAGNNFGVSSIGNVNIATLTPSSVVQTDGKRNLTTGLVSTAQGGTGLSNPGGLSVNALLAFQGSGGATAFTPNFTNCIVGSTDGNGFACGLTTLSGGNAANSTLTLEGETSFPIVTLTGTSQTVGINTTTPGATLFVQASSSASTLNIFGVASSTGTGLLTVASTGSTTISGLILGNIQSGIQCVHALSTGQVVGTGSDCGGSGNSAFTIGNGFIGNATSTDTIGLGSTTPVTTAQVLIQGSGTKDYLDIASSTGANVVQILNNTQSILSIGTSSTSSNLMVQGNSSFPTQNLFNLASSTGASQFQVTAAGNVKVATLTPSSLVGSDANSNLQSFGLGGGTYLTGSTLNTVPICTYTVNQNAAITGTNFHSIQLALDAANAAGGGRICLTDTAYTIAATLKIGSNITLSGDAYGTVLTVNGATVSPLIQASSTSVTNAVIQDMIMSNSNAAASTTAIAIDSSNMSVTKWDDIEIGGQGFGRGVNLNDTNNQTFYDTFSNLRIFNGLNGIYASSTNAVNDDWFNNIRIANTAASTTIANGSNCLYFNNAQAINISNVDCEPTTSANHRAVRLDTANIAGFTFVNLYAEGNATGTEVTSSGAKAVSGGVTFIGGEITANTVNISDTISNYINVYTGSGVTFNTSYVPQILKATSGSSAIPLTVTLDTSAASQNGILVQDATNFAQTGTLLQVKILNGSDTAPGISVQNAGTGNSLQVTNSGGGVLTEITSLGRIGINSSTPNSWLTVQASSTASIPIFTIASSSNGTYLKIDQKGHMVSGGIAPTVTSCGSTPNGSVTGTDDQGTITLGGTAPTACTLTFSTARTNNYSCQVDDNSVTVASDVSATSTTAVTFGLGVGGLAGGNLFYHCEEFTNSN